MNQGRMNDGQAESWELNSVGEEMKMGKGNGLAGGADGTQTACMPLDAQEQQERLPWQVLDTLCVQR